MRLPAATCLAIALVAATGCSGADDELPEDAEDGMVVEDDKSDNFYSLKAKEFIVSGVGRITVEEGATDARVRKAIALEHTAITWFLNAYLVDKETGAHGDANADYGGFSAMVKNGSYETFQITQRNATTYDFEFQQTIAGAKTLMRDLPLNASSQFTIEIGKPTLEEMQRDAEWYRKAPWNAWNPANVPASQKESLTLTIKEDTKSSDGWWDYARLFEDGKLTIDAHFGYDYNPEAAHITDPKMLYSWLLARGFRSPVSSFDKLTRASGPLTKTLDADGKQVRVEIRLFYPKPGSANDPNTDAGGKVLEKDMFSSLASRDVIVYSGHSGPLYGFALANWDKTDEGDVDDVELAATPMWTGHYQIVFAEGCNTYMLGSTLMKNPSTTPADVDVITTTSFSVSYSPVQDFVGRLLELDSQGRHRPRTMSQTIADLDTYSVGEASLSMYGIHGIDNNPKVHPYANLENSCKSCSSNSACGGVGNACVSVGTSGRRCVAACTSDSGCQTGYQCKQVASSSTSTIYGSYCVPQTRSCN
jgi:hypothetical protein